MKKTNDANSSSRREFLKTTSAAAMTNITENPAQGRSTVWPMSEKRIASIM